MRILLPPSEAKTTGGRGKPLRSRAADARAPLGPHRQRAFAALAELLTGDPATAADALFLPAGVADDALRANAAVLDTSTRPALDRYDGTVYRGIADSGLSPAARRRLGRSTLVFSGLLGVVAGDEPVPEYRVPAKASLPGLGIAGTYWRPVLTGYLPGVLGKDLVVDLRSSDYAAMWRPTREQAQRVLTVRVLSPKPDGSLGVLSYPSKYAKGRLAAALAQLEADGHRIRSARDVVEAWRARGDGPAADLGGGVVEIQTPAQHAGAARGL